MTAQIQPSSRTVRLKRQRFTLDLSKIPSRRRPTHENQPVRSLLSSRDSRRYKTEHFVVPTNRGTAFSSA